MACPTPLAPNGDANRTAPRHDRNSALWLHRRLQTEKHNSCRQAGKGIHRHTERAQTHHPTEIKATLHAAQKFPHNKVWCVFQPHTFSRTRTLWDEFVGAFDDADELILTHIYAAREKFDGVTKPENLAEDIKKRGVNAQYIDKFEDIAEFLKKNVKEGDIVFTMGAGDVVNINKLIVE